MFASEWVAEQWNYVEQMTANCIEDNVERIFSSAICDSGASHVESNKWRALSLECSCLAGCWLSSEMCNYLWQPLHTVHLHRNFIFCHCHDNYNCPLLSHWPTIRLFCEMHAMRRMTKNLYKFVFASLFTISFRFCSSDFKYVNDDSAAPLWMLYWWLCVCVVVNSVIMRSSRILFKLMNEKSSQNHFVKMRNEF